MLCCLWSQISYCTNSSDKTCRSHTSSSSNINKRTNLSAERNTNTFFCLSSRTHHTKSNFNSLWYTASYHAIWTKEFCWHSWWNSWSLSVGNLRWSHCYHQTASSGSKQCISSFWHLARFWWKHGIRGYFCWSWLVRLLCGLFVVHNGCLQIFSWRKGYTILHHWHLKCSSNNIISSADCIRSLLLHKVYSVDWISSLICSESTLLTL